MIIEAPAKVNLHLAVFDKRPDGFHNLESLFVALDFGDTLYFEPKTGGKNALELIMEGSAAARLELPIEKNIIFKALSLFREKCYSKGITYFNKGLTIRVEKRIPAGGGLGGGSSDAASTLLALNQLADFPLERSELLEMGAALGSDVPFFIHRIPAAWVTGRGEYIEPLEPQNWHFVLVNPGFKSDTGRAFFLLDEKRKSLSANEEKGRGTRDEGQGISVSKPNWLTTTNDSGQRIHSPFFNDFLEILPEKSTYNQIISQLTNLGAEFAGLSGSGSTCLGVFTGIEQAEKAALSLKNEWDFAQACSVIIF